MSRGKQLQEMEAGTKQSKTAVNANAKAADPMPHLTTGIPDGQSAGGWEDLGGPRPEDYTNDPEGPAKLKTPESKLDRVKDVVTKNAKPAEAMKVTKEDNELEDEDLIDEEISEDSEYEEEVVAEEADEADEEVVAEEADEADETDEDEELEEDFEFDVEEDVTALVENEDLSEEFKDKAKVIFESALKSKVTQIKESLEIAYEQRLVEEVEEIKEALTDRIDSYLEYVSEEWLNENRLSVENGVKSDLTESFMSGLKGLFEDHYVSIPEDKYDVLESMVEKLDEMETKLNEQIEKNVSLNKRLAESVADGIFDQISEGLALSQKEKLASLAESVEFGSEEEYREKLEILKEAYFSSKRVPPTAKTETLSEGVDVVQESVSGPMAAYLKTLSAFSKN
jgi:hypothetical protein